MHVVVHKEKRRLWAPFYLIILDQDEINIYNTDSNKEDSDDDRFNDLFEIENSLDPNLSNTNILHYINSNLNQVTYVNNLGSGADEFTILESSDLITWTMSFQLKFRKME